MTSGLQHTTTTYNLRQNLDMFCRFGSSTSSVQLQSLIVL